MQEITLGVLPQSSSRVITELVRAEETRGRHLFTMMQEEPWMLVAHDEVVRHLDDVVGFGRLARRQEKFLGLPEGHLTPDRREHQAHSTSTRPTPAGRPSPLEASTPGGFLVFATSEILMNHAQRVVDALGLYLDRAGIPYQPLAMTPALEAMMLDRDQQQDQMIAALLEWARLERQPFHKSEPPFPQPPGANA